MLWALSTTQGYIRAGQLTVGALGPVNHTGLYQGWSAHSWCFGPCQPHRVISGLVSSQLVLWALSTTQGYIRAGQLTVGALGPVNHTGLYQGWSAHRWCFGPCQPHRVISGLVSSQMVLWALSTTQGYIRAGQLTAGALGPVNHTGLYQGWSAHSWCFGPCQPHRVISGLVSSQLVLWALSTTQGYIRAGQLTVGALGPVNHTGLYQGWSAHSWCFGPCQPHSYIRAGQLTVGALGPVNHTGLYQGWSAHSWCFEPCQPHRVISGLVSSQLVLWAPSTTQGYIRAGQFTAGALNPVNHTGLYQGWSPHSWCFEPCQPHSVISGLVTSQLVL